MGTEAPDLATVKGHGFKVGDVVDFYGMGKDGIPSEQPTRCVLGKLGNGYMLTTVKGEVLTWEFGTASKIYAVKMTEEALVVELHAEIDARLDAELAEIKADNFRGGPADGSVKVVKIVPTPTVEDIAAMTGDPVGWVNGLFSERALGAVLSLVMGDTDPDTAVEMRDERMMAKVAPLVGDMVFRSSDAQQGTIVYILEGMTQVKWVNGSLSQLDLSDLAAMGFEVIPAAEVTEGMKRAEWQAMERDIWAGTDTMRAPMRTKVNKRKRNQAKRARHAFAGRGR